MKQSNELETSIIDLKKMEEISKTGDQKIQVYLAAKEYIKQGIYVLPLVPNGKKLPSSRYNINYGNASRNPKIIDKWFGPDGIFEGWNIGIACGREGGVFAVDVDRHGSDDGLTNLQKLEQDYGELPPTPMQITPSGGRHYLFHWQENANSSTGKIAKSIDTRGGTEKSCKGHIVAFPSMVDDRQYEWAVGGTISEIPSWIMERMGIAWQPPKKQKVRGNEEVGEDDYEQKLELEQINRMLASIDPDDTDYDKWLRIGLAIKSQYPGEEGLKIWDEWSKKGHRYKKGECHTRWEGFSDCGTVRIGTLFYHATESGWEPKSSDKKPNKFDVLIEGMNQIYAIVVVGGKIRILREKRVKSDAMSMHYDLLGKDDFRTLLQNDVVEITNEKGKVKRVPIADIWLAHDNRRTYPEGMGLYPDGKAPPGWYNTWNGFSIEPRKGDCSLFLNHIKEVICNGNKQYFNWLLDWCADSVQYPDNPKGTAIVMRGPEGSGKGTLANTMGELFGSHYRHLIDDSHLTSNFNAHMIDAIFVFADEITWGGNKRTSGKLKGMVTEKWLVGERKGVDAVGYKNMIHMMIASNSSWVIPAGMSSRRWFVLDISDKHVRDKPYFDEINYELDNGGREALLHMLLNREITHNLREAPTTKALKEQRARSSGDDTTLQWWVNTLVKGVLEVPDEKINFEPGAVAWPRYVNKALLYDDYKTWCKIEGVSVLPLQVFYVEIKKYGFRPVKIRKKNKRIPTYQVPSVEEGARILKDRFDYDIGEDDD